MDWNVVGRIWEKWASNNVGTSGHPLKVALLINYDPVGPSRLLSTIAKQEGVLKGDPIEASQFISFVKRNKLQEEFFTFGGNKYIVTSIHENWFNARCMNTSKQAGGAIVMRTSSFLLVGFYEGSVGSASSAMVAVDQLYHQFGKRNL